MTFVRAAIFHGKGKPITIEQLEMPRLGPDDVLVKVALCGICGSDVSMTGAGPATYRPGRIGHEYSGEIVEVGANVDVRRRGQRIACFPITPCGRCKGCASGNPMFCTARHKAFDGTTGFGGFADYVALPAGGAKPLPDSLSFADGALIEPMACGLHALRLARMKQGANVLVLGAGSMALSMIYWARRLGADRIVVATRSSRAREIVGALGADAFHSFSEDDPAALPALLGDGPQIVAECVGKEGMLARALEHVGICGTVISMGMCQHGEPIIPQGCTFKEVRMIFPVGYTVDEFLETARTFDRDGFHPAFSVSNTIALDALPATIEALRAGHDRGKTLVDPGLG